MAVDRSKRIHISVSDEAYQALEDWSDQQGRPTANLASFLIERSIAQAKESGEYKPSQQSEAIQNDDRLDRAYAYIKAVLQSGSIDAVDLSLLASDAGLEPGELHTLLKKNKGRAKNGS